MSTRPGRICIIGGGAFGRFCLDAYLRTPGIVVTCVVDPDPAALSSISVPGVRLETDWRRGVEDTEPEVVHIATPPHVREPIVKAAIAAGKSVFCEKPPALSMVSLNRMLDAARTGNMILSVDYVMRHLTAFHFLRSLVGSGLLGGPRTLSFANLAQRVPTGHWFWDLKRSGGIFVEHGIHFFDTYAGIFGRAESVSALAPRPEINAAAVTYEGGRNGFYLHDFSYPVAVEQTRAELGFDRATVTITGWIPTGLSGMVEHVQAWELRNLAQWTGVQMDVTEVGDVVYLSADFPDRQRQYGDAIVAGIRDVIAAHRGEAAPPITSSELRYSLAVALAAQQAAESRQPVAPASFLA